MTRAQIEALVGCKITDAEWRGACELLELIERHPDAEAVFDLCTERGFCVDETIQALSKLPPLGD